MSEGLFVLACDVRYGSDLLLSGSQEYDPYDVTHRIEANMDLYNAPGGCSMFRIFQGWIAMSKIVTGGGTLRVCPLIKEPTAYFMMKPLLEKYLSKRYTSSWGGAFYFGWIANTGM